MATRRPATVLREAFAPGDPVSLDEAAAVLHGDRGRASKALTYLAESGYFEKVRQRLWVRVGTSPNPYRLGARVASPYAFAYGTALALHPRRFETFEYDGALYRRALPWPEGALVKVSVGPEFVWTTTPERTLVDCVRVPANAGGIAELLRAISALRGSMAKSYCAGSTTTARRTSLPGLASCWSRASSPIATQSCSKSSSGAARRLASTSSRERAAEGFSSAGNSSFPGIFSSPQARRRAMSQVLLSLDGFSKKTRKTPPANIRLAERRLADWRRRARPRS